MFFIDLFVSVVNVVPLKVIRDGRLDRQRRLPAEQALSLVDLGECAGNVTGTGIGLFNVKLMTNDRFKVTNELANGNTASASEVDSLERSVGTDRVKSFNSKRMSHSDIPNVNVVTNTRAVASGPVDSGELELTKTLS